MKDAPTRSGPGEFAGAVGPDVRGLRGLIRRMAITLTSKALWQLLGHKLLDDTDETPEAEVFSGIGFFARPSASGKPEAIVVFPGLGAGSPIVIAARDEATRKAVADGFTADTTAMFNSLAILVIDSHGKISARSATGAAAPLATLADIEALKAWAATHTHAGVTVGAGVTGTPPVGPPSPTGTEIFEAE